MYRISKRFTFSASHQLDVPIGHPCGRVHGHNYVVELVLEAAELDAHGFIVDYRELQLFKDLVDTLLDHQHLNDVVDFEPTAENIAAYLFTQARQLWSQVCEVRVSETEKTWASYIA